MMEDRLRDLLHCDEQLRNTLHTNDKEKLRQKLELLQREHHKTFQRLRRAEHLDSVRSRIRSKITRHDSHGQAKAHVKPCSSTVEHHGTREAFPGSGQKQQCSPGVASEINNTEMKTQAIGSSLLSDMAYTPTSDSSQDSAQIPKAGPTLRLRSRRSRIRWATRSSQSNQSSANNQDALKETDKATGEQENGNPLNVDDTTVSQKCSEELFSPPKNESPSLLLPHWNSQGQAEKDETRNKLLTPENGICLVLDCEEQQLNSTSVLLQTKTASDNSDNACSEARKGDAQLTETNESSKNLTVLNMEKPNQEEESKRLLDSCTLVEGLLFPAEYYVRTTRRMAMSQSQPDMNAIILSHLSRGRPRRGKGRGRTLSRAVSVDGDFFSEAFKNTSESSNNSPSSCEISKGTSCSLDGGAGLAVVTPSRGRRGRRGRGRRRTPGRTGSLKVDMKGKTSDAHADGVSPKFVLPCDEAAAIEEVPTADTCGVAALTSVEPVESLNDQRLYRTRTIVQNQRHANGPKNTEDWASLLLSSSSQSSAPPLSPLPPVTLFKTLLGPDIQDFHLPDDQFASLKLFKLRQITAGVEQFTPRHTSPSVHRAPLPQLIPVSLSPTPDIRRSFSEQEADPVVQINFSKSGETLLASNGDENAGTEFGNTSQGRTELTNDSVDIFNLASTQEGKKETIMINKQENCKKLSSADVEMSALEKETNVRDAMESEPQIVDNSDRTHKKSRHGDPDFVKVEKGNEDSLAYLQSQHQKPLLESFTQNKHSEANAENICISLSKTHETLCNSNHPTQLLLSPSLEMASCPLTLPHLGLTPRSAPTVLSPCSVSPRRAQPPSLPLTPPSHQCRAASDTGESQMGAAVQGCEEEAKTCTYILKAPAGGRLVDVCCVASSSGAVWVAAAGTWAVCLWKSQDHVSQWSLCHTWSFEEPVINVFPVPDALDLFCVTLGQLEIRQVRVLSCHSLSQTLLCDCVVQTAMGAPKSRVVCSSHASTACIIRVYTLSNHSAPHCLPLVSPGGSLCSLASVEGLPDALIGTDECGSLLIWNMKTGHLLQKVTLGDGLSHCTCLRAYSHSGALFALMQLHSLGAVKEPSEGSQTQDRALFSLLVINPRTGKSVLATRLYPPHDWFGRLCEAEVMGHRVVGLSQRGSVCVWDLQHPRDPPQSVGAPEGEGWHLARWGGQHVLLTVHMGNVTLHRYQHAKETKENLTDS